MTSNRYLILYKPYDVLTQFTDEEGRATLADYVPVPGVYAAGRLAHRITHPHWKLPKTYLVQVECVDGPPDQSAVMQLRRGVMVKGQRTAPARAELLPLPPDLPPRAVRDYHPTSWLRITLSEGRKRQVRRMTAAVGFPTLRLVRVAIGPLQLGDMQPGEWRDLSERERQGLFRAVGVSSQ